MLMDVVTHASPAAMHVVAGPTVESVMGCFLVLACFRRKYESGGLVWPFAYERVLIIFGLAGVLTACVLVAKRAYTQASGWLAGWLAVVRAGQFAH
jgi:hypothetical protein